MITRPERSSYTPIDFLGWHEAGSLILTPKFQRRHVWTAPARSYLIDTLLLGMPVPPIYIRVVQSPERNRIIREVIDGQQRISAILDFAMNKYALSKNIESELSGRRFKDLTRQDQDKIMQYPFICEVFHGIEDAQVLSIFARLNTHSVKLNAQELRNGRWFGHFKRLSYSLALDHLEFWKRMGIFSDSRIARMAEVELTSELLIVELAGVQDKKKSIDDFYEDLDETFHGHAKVADHFRKTIDAIVEACDDVLPESEFRRPPIFYSLYSAVFHRLFGVENVDLPTKRQGRLSADEMEALGNTIRELSEVILRARGDQDEDVPTRYQKFVAACLRQTDNIRPRQARIEAIYKRAFGG